MRDALRIVRGCVHHNDAAVVDQEHGLVDIVRDHVQAVAQVLQPVSFAGIDGWAARRLRNVLVLGDALADGCDLRHERVGLAGEGSCSGEDQCASQQKTEGEGHELLQRFV